MNRPEIAEMLRQVRELPALRGVVLDLLSSLNDPQVSVEMVAAKIAMDQAITAKLLRLANSPFFGLSRQITAVADAAAILGLRTVRNISLAAALTEPFDPKSCPGFDLMPFWRHAVGTALCAEALAKHCDADPAQAFSFGLLHDIGRLALAFAMPAPYAQMLSQQREQDLPLLEAEMTLLGLTHCEAGAILAEQWLLAPSLVRAISTHHGPPSDSPEPLVDLLHLADNFAHALDLGGEPDDAVPPLCLASWQRLGLSDKAVMTVFAETEVRYETLCNSLM